MRCRPSLSALLAMALAPGCRTALTVQRQSVSGTFQGTTSDGRAIVLTLEQHEEAYRGVGTIDGTPIVVSGPMSWSAVGTLSQADGSASGVRLHLAANGELLTIEKRGEPPVLLRRGGTPLAVAPGPFSGRYRAVVDGELLAEATIVQSGELLSGVGILFGDSVGITGRLRAPSRADGVVTYLDQSQTSFQAELSGDGRSVSLRGFGRPLELRRRD